MTHNYLLWKVIVLRMRVPEPEARGVRVLSSGNTFVVVLLLFVFVLGVFVCVCGIVSHPYPLVFLFLR